jgi:hypothetical protein
MEEKTTDKLKKEKNDLTEMLKSNLGKLFGIIIITLIIQRIIEIFRTPLGNSFLAIYLIIVSILSIELIILIVELVKYFDKKEGKFKVKKIFERLNIRGKPRIFEFLFFLALFLATIYATFVASAYYRENMNIEIIKNSWGFVVFYGFAIAFGWYHYIEKIDI